MIKSRLQREDTGIDKDTNILNVKNVLTIYCLYIKNQLITFSFQFTKMLSNIQFRFKNDVTSKKSM